MEKKSKKDLAEFVKVKKKLIAIKWKSTNPIHCLNFLKVFVDENLMKLHNSLNLNDFMAAGKYNFESTKQHIPYLISFIREVLEVDENSQTNICTEIQHTPQSHYVICLPAIDQSILQLDSQLESYFEACKGMVGNGASLVFIINNSQAGRNHPLSYSKWIEPLEMNSPNMHFNMVRTNLELLEHLRCVIKAVAELPHKRELEEGNMMYTSCMTSSGGASGGGEWKKMLMSFNNVSNDIAEAVVATYPTLSSLFKAYEECANQKEKDRLLENIVVRRGAGLTSTNRRLGPELSTRISTALLSLEPSQLLN